jgi:hypothetical protein
MSGEGDFVRDFKDLSIVPVSVSYEYEPCDILKAREIYVTRRQKYIKSEGEDLNSILTGIMQFKGGIHFNFCDIINENEVESCSGMEKNERFKALGEIMDLKINSTFHLWSNNYIAYDILYKTNQFSDKYSDSEREKFEKYISYKISDFEGDIQEIKEILLSIYANPVLGIVKSS